MFSWIEYPDRETRDRVNAATESDEGMQSMSGEMPFDGPPHVLGRVRADREPFPLGRQLDVGVCGASQLSDCRNRFTSAGNLDIRRNDQNAPLANAGSP